MKAAEQLEANMEKALEQLVAADEGNFQAKGELRLLRVVETLCAEEAGLTVAIMVTALSKVDPVMYKCLKGFQDESGKTQPTRLHDLLDDESPIAVCQSALLSLLDHWGPESDDWFLLRCVGGVEAFEKPVYQDFAKEYVIQLLVALISKIL